MGFRGRAKLHPGIVRVTIASTAVVALAAASQIWHWPQPLSWLITVILAVAIVVQVIVIRRRTRA
jgi:Flp pilus assembly protein TadB